MPILVQISDIHIGSLYNSSVFDEIVEEVNSMKPDAIIVTGRFNGRRTPSAI